jgi:hypothetical protein
VIAELNTKAKPLALFFFSTHDARIDQGARPTISGGVCINDMGLHYFSTFLPFGGASSSGIGERAASRIPRLLQREGGPTQRHARAPARLVGLCMMLGRMMTWLSIRPDGSRHCCAG